MKQRFMNRRFTCFTVAVACLVMGITATVAGGDAKTGAGAETGAAGGADAGAKGLNFRLNFSWPTNVGPLNPHLYGPNQMFAQAMVYEPLVRYQADGTLAPWLAQSWRVSDDGKVYTFHLRPGVTFSNGEPFDAAAVVANFRAILDNRANHGWLELANRIASVEAVDPLNVRLTLDRPYYPTLHELALPRPFRFAAPSQFRGGGSKNGLIAPIGTGPWTLAQTARGESDLFRRNDRYWGARPAFGEINVKVTPDPNTRAIAFQTGDIDLIYGSEGAISPDNFARFQKMKGVATAVSQPVETLIVALNSNAAPTNDLAVRQAINHAVNKDALVARVLHGTQTRADALFPADAPYANIGLEPYAYDPALAGRMLDEAGWVLAKGARIRARDGLPLEIDLVFTGNDAQSKVMAEVIQSDLAKAGIGVRLIGEEQGSVNARQHDGRFGMVFSRTWGAPYDPHAYVSSMRAPGHADFQAQRGLPDKAEIDAKIGKALATTDEAERQTLYRQILTRLHEAAIYLPLTHVTTIAVARPELGAIPFGAMASEIPFERMGKAAGKSAGAPPGKPGAGAP